MVSVLFKATLNTTNLDLYIKGNLKLTLYSSTISVTSSTITLFPSYSNLGNT